MSLKERAARTSALLFDFIILITTSNMNGMRKLLTITNIILSEKVLPTDLAFPSFNKIPFEFDVNHTQEK
jgi:hypothetical protein